MRLPDMSSRRGWMIWGTFCVILGLSVGWLFTTLPDAQVGDKRADSWVLPADQVVQRFDNDDFRSLMSSKAWATAKAGSAPVQGAPGAPGAPERPAWQLVGVVTTPEPAALILLSGATEVSRVAEGESLKDIGEVDHVEKSGVRMKVDGCVRDIQLFQSATDLLQKPCPTSKDKNKAASSEAGDIDD